MCGCQDEQKCKIIGDIILMKYGIIVQMDKIEIILQGYAYLLEISPQYWNDCYKAKLSVSMCGHEHGTLGIEGHVLDFALFRTPCLLIEEKCYVCKMMRASVSN